MTSPLQELVFQELIKQAGVDFESKPILVFYACHMPDPQYNDYDQLLQLILQRLDEFVESDYVLVLFSAPAINKPSWSWLLKAYRSLGRKYRKNLKNLYIVHPNTWTKLLMKTFGTVISPKFTKKLVWVPALSRLGALVPMKQISIPELVQRANQIEEEQAEKGGFVYNLFNSEKKATPVVAFKPKSVVFGVALEKLMGKSCELGIPRLVSESILFIETFGLQIEGIFRRSPASNALHEAKSLYETNAAVDFEDFGGVHVPCVLLKMFFRELPVPVFSKEMYPVIKSMNTCKSDDERIIFIRQRIIPILSAQTCILLKQVFGLLHQVHLNSAFNKMTASNLAIVWTPNLVRSEDVAQDFEMCSTNGGSAGNIVRLAVEYYSEIWK